MAQPQRAAVKIAVVGDAGSGKTSLISTTANDTFDARPAPVLPPTRLPAERTPDYVPMIVTDTSSRPEDQQVVDLVLQQSDAVVVCFDATRQSTLDSIRSHWYARIQQLNPGVPVIMACCKADRLEQEREVNILRERVELAVHDLSHVEVCLNCSAKTLRMVNDVFFYALKSVLYPLQPLYDRLEKRLRPLCIRALKRVFIMCDQDMDGALKDAELNDFQLVCFGLALDAEELQNVKQIVASKMPAGVSARGITLEGFLFLHVLFIERGRLESTWAVLRKFGYNDQVLLSDEVLDRVNFTLPADQVWELSDTALDFLVRKFSSVDEDGDQVISWQQLDALFSTIPPEPVAPWQGDFWYHVLVPGMSGTSHNLEAFLLKWQVHTLVDPRSAYANLLYMGYGGPDGSGGPALLARGTRRKSDKRYRGDLAARTTVQCLVFGPPGCGKTSLLRACVGMRPDGPPTTTTGLSNAPKAPFGSPAGKPGSFGAVLGIEEEGSSGARGPGGLGGSSAEEAMRMGAGDASWTSVALVKGPDDKERTLVLHEVNAEQETRLITAAALAAHGATPLVVAPGGHGGPTSLSLDLQHADVAAFVFDSSSPASFRQAMDLLVKVSTYAGDNLPCVLIATKDELVMGQALEAAVTAALSDLQLQACVRTSALMGDLNRAFQTLVAAAINPEGWIPETPARKAHRRLMRQLLTGAVACTVTAGIAYCAYRLFSSSSTQDTASSGRGASARGSSDGSGWFRWGSSAPSPSGRNAASASGGWGSAVTSWVPGWGGQSDSKPATPSRSAVYGSSIKAHSVMEPCASQGSYTVATTSARAVQDTTACSGSAGMGQVAGMHTEAVAQAGVCQRQGGALWGMSRAVGWASAACAVALPVTLGLLTDA